MFTGIIEGQGAVIAIKSAANGKRFGFSSDFPLAETRIGDSIAVNGACLTVVNYSGDRFESDVSPETLRRTTLGSAKIGEEVNIERAMRFSDRIGGHLVSGHVDAIGQILKKNRTDNAIWMTIQASVEILKYMIPKGSVAVDGVSLTLNACHLDTFEVSIIPHTAKMTTVGSKRPHDRVNIEADMIGKYVAHILSWRERPSQENAISETPVLDRAYLEKTGFI